MRGELNEGTVINIHMHPEWIELRTVIVAALEPHADARRAVLRALQGMGNGAA